MAPLQSLPRVFPGLPASMCLCIPGQLTLIVQETDRHISTPLAPATKKHINWLQWEPCLVTMAKHTGREEEECWDGAAGSTRSLSGDVFRSFPLLQPRLSFSLCLCWTDRLSLFLSLPSSHINTICIFLSLLPHSSYWCWLHQSALTSYYTPLFKYPVQHNLPLCNLPFFLTPSPTLSSIAITFPPVERHGKDKRELKGHKNVE